MAIILATINIIIFLHYSFGSDFAARSSEFSQRIDCFPEAETKFSSYSKENCLKRQCLFDEWSPPGIVQCYLNPKYGYLLKEDPQVLPNGIRLRLQRNQAVGSMFSDPIENVILDVQYYSNEIVRFQLYDEDHERYQV